MNVDKAALLVGKDESHLTTIISQLENLKLEVTQTRDHEQFPDILGVSDKLALIAVDANGLDELRGREVFHGDQTSSAPKRPLCGFAHPVYWRQIIEPNCLMRLSSQMHLQTLSF